jgi:uncharacterized membrane protein YGL010W
MTKLDQLLSEYGESHKNSTNKLIHWIAVPSIVFSLLGLVWSIPMPDFMVNYPYFNWASIVIAFSLYYYWQLSAILAFAMIFVVGLFSYLIVQLEYLEQAGFWPLWLVCVLIFTVAWVFQFIGHKVEGKKPSFLKDVQFLLIGPIWLLHFVFKKLGLPYQKQG